jgi:GT2 family glycosyltransferase
MAIRREVLDAVGPFDEGYFLYYEEVDFCRRAARAGWSCWFVADAAVVHFEGASTGIKDARRPLPAYWFASRRRFFIKSYGAWGLFAADVLRCLGRASLVLRRTLGLGGRHGVGDEPARATRDLVASDLQALWRGEWLRLSRERRAS